MKKTPIYIYEKKLQFIFDKKKPPIYINTSQILNINLFIFKN